MTTIDDYQLDVAPGEAQFRQEYTEQHPDAGVHAWAGEYDKRFLFGLDGSPWPDGWPEPDLTGVDDPAFLDLFGQLTLRTVTEGTRDYSPKAARWQAKSHRFDVASVLLRQGDRAAAHAAANMAMGLLQQLDGDIAATLGVDRERQSVASAALRPYTGCGQTEPNGWPPPETLDPAIEVFDFIADAPRRKKLKSFMPIIGSSLRQVAGLYAGVADMMRAGQSGDGDAVKAIFDRLSE